MPFRVAATLFAGVAVLGGCTAQEAKDGPRSLEQIAADARAKGHDWQADALDDGDITLAEYDEGHRRGLACLTTSGMTYTEPERMLTDGFRWDYVISWEGMSDDVGSRESQACFDENLGDLELAMSSWGDWRTDPALLVFVEECVKSAGFDVESGSRNYRDVWLSTADQGLTREQVSSCVSNGMQMLYPGAGFGVAF